MFKHRSQNSFYINIPLQFYFLLEMRCYPYFIEIVKSLLLSDINVYMDYKKTTWNIISIEVHEMKKKSVSCMSEGFSSLCSYWNDEHVFLLSQLSHRLTRLVLNPSLYGSRLPSNSEFE